MMLVKIINYPFGCYMGVNKFISPRQATGQLSDSAGGRPSVNVSIVWIAVSNSGAAALQTREKIHLPMLSLRSVNMGPMGAYVDLYRDFSGPLGIRHPCSDSANKLLITAI
jgi:hypothetical protein